MAQKGYMEEVIRSVAVGDTLTFPLEEVNSASWRAKAGLVNAKDGWLHYSITVNTAMGVMGIINHGDKFKKANNN